MQSALICDLRLSYVATNASSSFWACRASLPRELVCVYLHVYSPASYTPRSLRTNFVRLSFPYTDGSFALVSPKKSIEKLEYTGAATRRSHLSLTLYVRGRSTELSKRSIQCPTNRPRSQSRPPAINLLCVFLQYDIEYHGKQLSC